MEDSIDMLSNSKINLQNENIFIQNNRKFYNTEADDYDGDDVDNSKLLLE